ncbi:MAG: glycosyltransferase [Knoellia sp.]
MTPRPLVSVVVPVHNVVDYLAECLTSITGQSETNIEIVLVDDGSTDGSERLCDEWAARDTRVRVFHEPRQGSSVARNTGIEVASGDYLTFVDADDVMGPRLVEVLLRTAQEMKADIVLGEVVTFTGSNAVVFTEGTTVSVSPAADELVQIICVRPQWGPMAKLFRRQLFEDGPRFPEGLLHQDLAIMPHLFERASTCARTNAVVYEYRERPGSITDTVRRVALSTDLLTILRDNIEFARATRGPEGYQRYLGAYLIHARKQVERLDSAAAWERNDAFVRDYRAFMRHYVRELVQLKSTPVVQRTALTVSAVAPRPYVTAFRVARRLKSGRAHASARRHG